MQLLPLKARQKPEHSKEPLIVQITVTSLTAHAVLCVTKGRLNSPWSQGKGIQFPKLLLHQCQGQHWGSSSVAGGTGLPKQRLGRRIPLRVLSGKKRWGLHYLTRGHLKIHRTFCLLCIGVCALTSAHVLHRGVPTREHRHAELLNFRKVNSPSNLNLPLSLFFSLSVHIYV